MKNFILAIDQGTTSSRAMIFNRDGEVCAISQKEFPNFYPKPGWVEQNPQDIRNSVLETVAAVAKDVPANQWASVGITNQRETTIVWDRSTGDAIYPAIVWQDRRTADFCEQLKQTGNGELVTDKTGLLLDPYFSATKIRWILENVPGARQRASQGELAFGTVDTFLIWHLTNGKEHLTDATNASRTMLFNIHTQSWDPELLALFNIPESLLPTVKDSSDDYGVFATHGVPINGVVGDQQAALIGQACFEPGMVKSTYGTGCFMVMNTGDQALRSQNRLLSTVAYRINNKTTYALEGSIFMAGAAVQWLRDGINIIEQASECEALATSIDANDGVYLVPAFTGLGAPHWRADARGGIFGLTQDSGPAHLVRATLESVSYQTRDLMEAMAQDGMSLSKLRVDGGMVANHWLIQHLADQLSVEVARPKIAETTALGATIAAALGVGWFDNLQEAASFWQEDKAWQPKMDASKRAQEYAGWKKAVSLVLSN